MRTRLDRIAADRGLNALRTTRRRPAKAWKVPGITAPEPTRWGAVPWLEPFPEILLEAPTTCRWDRRPLRADRVDLARLRRRAPRAATVAARGPCAPRRAGLPRGRGGCHVDRSVDPSPARSNGPGPHSRRATRAGRADARAALGSAAEQELVARFRAAYEAADVARGGAADRRRLHVDAADPLRGRRSRRSASSSGCSSGPASSPSSRPGPTGNRPSARTSPGPTASDAPAG